MPPKRLIFDVSTLARTGGQAVGIVRVCRELARYAHSHRSDVVFALYDTAIDSFREINPKWLLALLDGSVVIDLSVLPGDADDRRRARHRAPRALRNTLAWLQQPRRRAIVALERIRLAGGPAARWAEHVSERLLSPRYRRELTGVGGVRRALLPYHMAVGAPVELAQGDVLVFTGSEWDRMNFDALRERKAKLGFSIVVLTYDTIPLLFPRFYREQNAEAFRQFFHNMIPMADLVVVTARQIERDAQQYCAKHGLHLANSAIVPLGADPIRIDETRPPSLPQGLEAGRYALYVSTIEPRKNHALLLAVWKRLCTEGVAQAQRFKLVLVGRPGWLVDDVLAGLRVHAEQGYGLLLLSGVDDRQLGDLYRGAAFCLFPSLYEGYGLPIVEGFHYGKAVLASGGGALAEVTGEFSPTLDPHDENAWHQALSRWIEDPQARAPYEAAIRERFRHPNWEEAARRFFAAIDKGLR